MEHFSSHEIGTFSVSCIAADSLPYLRTELVSREFRSYELDGSNILDKGSLVSEISHTFSLDRSHQLMGHHAWDALSDLLWQHFMEQKDRHVALIWRHAEKMLDGQLQLLLDAITVFLELIAILEREEFTESTHPILFRLLLVGIGNNFPKLQ